MHIREILLRMMIYLLVSLIFHYLPTIINSSSIQYTSSHSNNHVIVYDDIIDGGNFLVEEKEDVLHIYTANRGPKTIVGEILIVKDEEAHNKLLLSETPTIIQYCVPWCASCKLDLSPQWKSLAIYLYNNTDANANVNVNVAFMNMYENRNLVNLFGLLRFPAIRLIPRPTVVYDYFGVQERDPIVNFIRRSLSPVMNIVETLEEFQRLQDLWYNVMVVVAKDDDEVNRLLDNRIINNTMAGNIALEEEEEEGEKAEDGKLLDEGMESLMESANSNSYNIMIFAYQDENGREIYLPLDANQFQTNNKSTCLITSSMFSDEYDYYLYKAASENQCDYFPWYLRCPHTKYFASCDFQCSANIRSPVDDIAIVEPPLPIADAPRRELSEKFKENGDLSLPERIQRAVSAALANANLNINNITSNDIQQLISNTKNNNNNNNNNSRLETIRKTAVSLHMRMGFAIIDISKSDSQNLWNSLFPTLDLSNDNNLIVTKHTGEFYIFNEINGIEKLHDFASAITTNLVQELRTDNYAQVVSSKVPNVILFLDVADMRIMMPPAFKLEGNDILPPNDEAAKFLSAMITLSNSHHQQYKFMYNNGFRYLALRERLDIANVGLPSAIILDLSNEKHYLLNTSIVQNENDLEIQLKAFERGDVFPVMKSHEPQINEKQRQLLSPHVTPISYNTMMKLINNNSENDVFLLIHAPWCVFVKTLRPLFYYIATTKTTTKTTTTTIVSNNISFVEINVDENDVPSSWNVVNLPELILFPASSPSGSKGIKYQGARTFEGINDFLQVNLNFNH